MIGGRRIAQWSEATRDAFRKSRLARDVSVLGGATLGAQALGVLFTPIVTRLYDSAAFGMFAIFSSYLVVGATVVGLHFDLLIPSADSDGEAAALGASALIASVAVSALATAAYAALILLEGSSFAMLPLWSALPMGVLLVVSGWTLAARYLCIRQGQFSVLGRLTLVQAVSRTIGLVVGGFVTGSWAGLLIGEAGGRLTGIRSLRSTLATLWEVIRSSGGIHRAWGAARRGVSYIRIALPSSLIDVVATSVPAVLITSRYGLVAAGEFFLASRLLAAPASLVVSSVADVFHHRASSRLRSDATALRDLLRGAARRLLLVGGVLLAPVAVGSIWLAGPVLGARWAPVGVLIALLAPGVLASAVVGPLSRVLAVVRRPGLKLSYDVVALTLAVLPFLSGVFDFSFLGAVTAYSVGRVLGYLLYYLLLEMTVSQWKPAPETSA